MVRPVGSQNVQPSQARWQVEELDIVASSLTAVCRAAHHFCELRAAQRSISFIIAGYMRRAQKLAGISWNSRGGGLRGFGRDPFGQHLYLVRASGRGGIDTDAAQTGTVERGMVHPWVGQIVLKCNVFKTIFVRPTETLARNHDDA